MITIFKCELCGKTLLEGDFYSVAGQLIVNVAPCGCRSTETDCSDCEDMEILRKMRIELKELKEKIARDNPSKE